MENKILPILGWIATITGMMMYISYIPQIIANLHGHQAGFIQPLIAGINCILWVCYGLFKRKKDWPIVITNFPGIIFGFAAFITAL